MAPLRPVGLRLRHSPFFHFLLLRAQQSSSASGGHGQLLVANLPPCNAENSLRTSLSACGPVSEVLMVREDLASVTFENEVSVKRAVSCGYLDGSTVAPESGLDRFVALRLGQYPDARSLKDAANKEVAAFELREKQAADNALARSMKADEDGFVRVTYRTHAGGRRGQARAGSAAHTPVIASTSSSTAAAGGTTTARVGGVAAIHADLYAAQRRESKLKRLERLRERFEHDKRKIARMKAARRFKPY